jgi:CHAT domain-containing protein/tetratricopeptide (TPR) repeat protein
MKSFAITLLLVTISYFHVIAQSKIPLNPNKTDAKGLRQGKWTITFNKDWLPTTDKKEIAYYRLITYKDNIPLGKVNDFYLTGRKQFEGILLADQPADVIDGTGIFYYENGVKKEETQYTQGIRNGKSIAYNEKGIKTWESTFKNDTEIDIKFFSPNGVQRQPTKWVEMNKLGDIYHENGKYDLALTSFKQALTQAETEFGKKHKNYVLALQNMGSTYRQKGDYAQAETLIKGALELQKELTGEKSESYVQTLKGLAYVYLETSDYEQAATIYEQALQIRKEIYGEKHKLYAESLDNLGVAYLNLGVYTKAEPVLTQALQIRKEIIGEKVYDYGISLNNLAGFYIETGNLSQAEILYQQTLEVFKNTIGDKHPNYATILGGLASVYTKKGNYTKAEPYLLQALQIRKETLGEKHPYYASVLYEVSVLYFNMKNYPKAEELNKTALEITRQTLGEKHPSYARMLQGLGIICDWTDRYPQGQEYFKQAQKIYKESLGEKHPLYASVLDDLGKNYIRTQKYAEAEEVLAKSVEIRKELLGEKNRQYAMSLYDLAFSYEMRNNFKKTEPLLIQANVIMQENIANDFLGMTESDKKSCLQVNSYVLTGFRYFCIDFFRKNKKYPETLGSWYDLEISSKGLLLESTEKTRKRILNSNDPALIKSFESWENLRQQIAKAKGLSVQELAKRKIKIDVLEAKANEMERKLSIQSEAFRNSYNPPVIHWQDIQKKLKPGEAAIEIIRVGINRPTLKDTVYAALIITPKSKKGPELVLFDDGSSMETKGYHFYRNSILAKQEDKLSYNLFWQPIQEKLKSAKTKKVYFSPDGVYNTININALQNPVTRQFVLDEIDIHLITNTKELALTQVKTDNPIKTGKLFGHPAYRIDPIKAKQTPVLLAVNRDFYNYGESFENAKFTDLPGTDIEIRGIDSLLTQATWQITTYLQERATEENVKALRNPTVLHIATHGYFLPSAGNNNAEPMLRSGIIMAGTENYFSAKVKPDTDDGVLSAYEVMNMDLDETELVALSACETGLGELAYGEGVYGLQRAFRVAGARSLMMSLWKVNDQATQELMRLFYAEWVKTGDKRSAFRKAQQLMKVKFNYPYFWAAFVMSGD